MSMPTADAVGSVDIQCQVRRRPEYASVTMDSEKAVLDALAPEFTANVSIPASVLVRMHELWSALQANQADEIGDWSIDARASLASTHRDGPQAPVVLAVCCTVFSHGEVHLGLHLEGFDSVLWCTEQIDLSGLT